MIFMPIELWEKREAELNLLEELLKRERNRLAGVRTYSLEEIDRMAEDILHEG